MIVITNDEHYSMLMFLYKLDLLGDDQIVDMRPMRFELYNGEVRKG